MKVLTGENVGRTNQHTHPPDSPLADVAETKARVKRQAEGRSRGPGESGAQFWSENAFTRF